MAPVTTAKPRLAANLRRALAPDAGDALAKDVAQVAQRLDGIVMEMERLPGAMHNPLTLRLRELTDDLEAHAGDPDDAADREAAEERADAYQEQAAEFGTTITALWTAMHEALAAPTIAHARQALREAMRDVGSDARPSSCDAFPADDAENAAEDADLEAIAEHDEARAGRQQ